MHELRTSDGKEKEKGKKNRTVRILATRHWECDLKPMIKVHDRYAQNWIPANSE